MITAADYQKDSDQAPRFVNSRFAPDGSVLPFAGLTFVSMVAGNRNVSAWLVAIVERLRALPGADAFAWLPPSSHHMTLFEGVCDQVRSADVWPQDVALDAPMAHLCDVFIQRTRGCAAPAVRALQFTGLESGQNGGGLVLSVAPTPESDSVLRRHRDRLAEALLLRAPNHESYRFHVTLAYLVRWMTAEEAIRFKEAAEKTFSTMASHLGRFDLEPARLCDFPDMTRFVPVVQANTDQPPS